MQPLTVFYRMPSMFIKVLMILTFMVLLILTLHIVKITSP